MKLISLHKNYTTLIKKARKGNRRAQHELYQLFAPKMLSVCRQYLKNNNLAEEIMLNGFYKVFTKLESYSDQCRFLLIKMCGCLCSSISELRRQKKLYIKDESVIENSLEYATTIDTGFEVAEIQKVIDSLPDGYKTVFILYAVEGYKHSEIAELLQISEGTSKSQLSKARKMLQNSINKQNDVNYGAK